MTDVIQRQTVVSAPQAISMICDAYVDAMGQEPTAEGLAILVSQSALETGQWHKMFNWNAGNIRGSYKGATQSIKGADEIIIDPETGERRRVVVERGFRAYPTAEEGFSDFVRFLMIDTTPDNGKPNKWHVAAAAVERGDLKTYVFALADPDGNPRTQDGYFTADADDYYDGGDGPGGRPGILGLYEQFLPRCQEHLANSDTISPTVPDTERPPPPDVTEHMAVQVSQIVDICKKLTDQVNAIGESLRVLPGMSESLRELKVMADGSSATLWEHDRQIQDSHLRISKLESQSSNGAGHG